MKIGVIGAGAWGTAFSLHLARRGHHVLLWVYEPELYDILQETRENTLYLPGFTLPERITFTRSLEALTAFSGDIVVGTPSFALRKTIQKASAWLSGRRILLLTKGFEENTLLRMSEVVGEVAGDTAGIGVLSGPSFAGEVARAAFTSVVVSSTDKDLSRHYQKMIHDDTFRVYTAEDVIGVEVGGAMKNVMAIGAGIIEGLQLGTNTQAAFTTRGLAEIKRLGKAMGAKETTFLGLSGIGDLVLTSYGGLSRNRAFGIELSKGRKPDAIIASQHQVVEGYYTINAAYTLSGRLGVEMPIAEELYKIVFQGKDLLKSINDIKKRGLKEEEV
ncbi:MAG: NAD(P)-dependent glycerol-3-phosphate dehydrogenase [Syntrophorhabdus aromaticivorans]|uniref:Glycerol-3-phosphate dehydrogenase [NAD(P)+] n=1 Tax=Syntrophorhabdus aromaticivorans TaxID=328301 RepID=A0A971M252_9BACT|nr:NAD(P)-dependent glycerol-3-phosphate dehydrogenase [Syntrophorhabdus aromaticivorans]